jgi:integrase
VKQSETFEASLRAVNAKLSRCKLVKHSERLYVRSSRFPPKPGSSSKRSEFATGYRATAKELKLAEGMAIEIDGQLLRDKFTWEDWLKEKVAKAETVHDWLERLKSDYFQRRERTTKSETTWTYSYWQYFQELPLNAELTEALLKGTLIKRYKGGSRSRQLCSVAYGMLAEFAGLSRVEITELGKGYRSAGKTSAQILTDDQVLFQIENCRTREWQCAAALIAVFGLRNHEVFKLDLTRLSEGIARVLADTKTGERLVYACPFEWIEKFNLSNLKLPSVGIEGRSNRMIGHSVNQGFKLNGLANPYAFRDAYAVRLEFYWEAGTPTAFKSRWMGHSSAVHDANYLDAIQEIHHEQMYERLRQGA